MRPVEVDRFHGKVAAIRYNAARDMECALRCANLSGFIMFCALLVLLATGMAVAMTACSRPATVTPADPAPTLTAPDDVCVGPDCAIPKPKR